jgi:hypothetical protein
LGHALAELKRDGSLDLEAYEFATREMVLRVGAMFLEHLLSYEDGSSVERDCECRGTFQDKKHNGKTIRTVLGPVRVDRHIQRCNSCRRWRVPKDIVLDVVKTGFSPGLRRMMAKSGAEVNFDKAQELIHDLAGLEVTDKDVERISEGIGEDICLKQDEQTAAIMAGEEPEALESPSTLYIAIDGTGVPVLRKETEGRKGKSADGVARSRETKLGALFTQTTTDEKGNPVRDEASTSYVGKIESADDFGPRLYAEALRRGLNQAGRVVVLGDGALWIWNLAQEHFYGAIQIVDYYHAKEHLSTLAKTLFATDEQERDEWLEEASDNLWKGKVACVVFSVRTLRLRGKRKDEVEKEMTYLEHNKERMRYGEFRRQGLFIGSGVVEAGCKSVIGQRLKQSGMHWSVRGANSIIALRCCTESARFEDYWESRLVK